MPETIQNLVKNLPLLKDTDAVRRQGNGYALNKDREICALSLSKSEAEAIVFDESAAALEHLYLNDNGSLREVRFAAPLPRLRRLYLSRCALTSLELPDGFAALEQLYVQGNQLQTLSFRGDCPNLQLLDAAKNQLSKFILPAGFDALAYLYLNDNRLERLEFLGELPNLNILKLNNNQLQELPKGKYGSLETLYVKGNPLKNYEETLINGDESGNALEIIGLLRAAARSGTRPNYRARLIIVGNGRTGKTCLVKRLLDEPCLDDQAFTHGISIRQLHKKQLPAVKTPELDLQVWDFGGQDVYFATHQFFLSEEASYIYAWTDRVIAHKNRENDKQRSPVMYDDKWHTHDYWLDNIRMHGLKSPVLIVRTHCLNSREELPFKDLKSKYDLSLPPLNFDAKSMEPRYVEDLKNALTESVNQLSLLGSDIPNSYDEVIVALRHRREKGDEELFKPEFKKLAVQAGIPESDMDGLLGYLKKTGEIIYFPDNEKLKERIFIDPLALIRKVYKLLENNDYLKEHEGVFSAQYAKEVFGWADCEVLMALLISFELVYEKKGDGIYIAPQYLPKLPESGNAHNIFEGHKKEKKRRFILRYPALLPDNVMVNVLSKYGPYSSDAAYRNGIYFLKEGTEEACLIECDEDRQIISVFTRENEAADRVAKDVFDQFLSLSKKATVHLALEESDWLDVRVARVAFEKNKDIPLLNGGWVEDKTALAFLFDDRRGEFLSDQKTIVVPGDQHQPKKTMPASTKTMIISFLGIIAILLLPIWKDGRGGKINLMGLIVLEIEGKSKGSTTDTTVQPATQEKVSVIGRITINNRQAGRDQIKEVFVKNDNRVNRESLSGDQFTLRAVQIPSDKRLDIAFSFSDGTIDSRVFNVSDIRDGVCDIGEIRISIKKRPSANRPAASAPSVITITNNNIIQLPDSTQ
ncbi:MAG: hypothetical protein HUU34_23015 [Saprospiraceae bacterium]|nr:hypothetical protein [Saprospiraceae bacterium]